MAQRRHRAAYIKGDAWQRFWAKVELGPVSEWRPDLGPCWLWTAATTHGYGAFSTAPGRSVKAHRWVYSRLCGGLSPDLHIDHLCAVPACVNPRHLDAVTNSENVRRMAERMTVTGGRKRPRLRTHCRHGHRYTPETTGRSYQWRACLVCNRARHVPKSRCKRGHLYETAGTTPGRHRRCYVCRPLSDRERRLIAQGKSPKTGKMAVA